MGKDLHEKAFDEGTIKKLEIFESYTKEWLPTFIMSSCPEVFIFDLFAGPGYSVANQPGSPIRILRQINQQIGNIFANKTKVYLLLNEYDKEKANCLKDACSAYCNANPELNRAVESKLLVWKVISYDCCDILPRVISCVKQYRSLLFLDQNGIKFISDEYFLPLCCSEKVDFLYYISSSYILRFGNTPEFKSIVDINVEEAKKHPYERIHRVILKQLQTKIPSSSKTKLYPFSIKKGGNIYGIVFGASHPRAVDKFLRTAWKENEINGEANFDIDHDIDKMQPSLFGDEYRLLTKIEIFQNDLRERIVSGQLKNNKEVYDYTIGHGHISSHADPILRELKKAKTIDYDGPSPRVNYENVYKKHTIVSFRIL